MSYKKWMKVDKRKWNCHSLFTSPSPERISCFGVVIIASVTPLSKFYALIWQRSQHHQWHLHKNVSIVKKIVGNFLRHTDGLLDVTVDGELSGGDGTDHEETGTDTRVRTLHIKSASYPEQGQFDWVLTRRPSSLAILIRREVVPSPGAPLDLLILESMVSAG
jgi:hypothetical protein